LRQLLLLISVHFKEFWREPGIIFWAIFFPILMAMDLGMAFNKKGDLVRTVAMVGTEENLVNLGAEQKGGGNEWWKKIGNKELGFTNYWA